MLTAILTILILGLICWFVNTTPIPLVFKNGIFVLCAIIAIILVFRAFGVPVFSGVSLR